MANKNEVETLIVFAAVLLILGVFIVLLFLIFLKRKNTLIKNKEEAEERYRQEINKTQIEIREETLRNISWELHDNIGQLITLAKIQMQNAKGNALKTEEAINTIAKALNELRALSKSINPNTIKKLSLIEAIDFDLKRFERLNFLKTNFTLVGVPKKIDINASIILFRILQEFFSNTIKHSKASDLKVKITFSQNTLIILAKDNGLGFNCTERQNGQGVNNMKNRAALINASFKLQSQQNKGTQLLMQYTLT